MNVERLHQVLRRPIVSEKSTNAADSGQQVVFEVLTDATKNEIKTAVESLFEVSVEGVQVINVRGDSKTIWENTRKTDQLEKSLRTVS